MLQKVSSPTPFNLLEEFQRDVYPKIYWYGRDGEEFLSLGKIARPPQSSLVNFHWKLFDDQDQGWENFRYQNYTPRWQFQNINKKFDFYHWGDPLPSKKSELWERPLQVNNIPSQDQWLQNCEDIIAKLNKEFPKVVLARRRHYQFQHQASALTILQNWRNKKAHQYLYAYCPNPFESFLCFSPERLFSRKKNQLFTEALAGTSSCEKELSNSEKDLYEHELVVQYIREQLSKIGKNIKISPQVVFPFGQIKHLYTPMSADVSQTPNENIINLLHPTPALGGHPRETALNLIKETSFIRGLYGAPFGYQLKNQSDFAVGIRSLLIQNQNLYSFSGAGIVQDSLPKKEWDETERKLDFLRPLL